MAQRPDIGEAKAVKGTPTKAEKKSPRKTIQEVILSTLDGKAMELEALRKKNPSAQKCLESVARGEFKTTKDGDKILIHPGLSEHGAERIAKYIGSRGIDHYWSKTESKKLLEAGMRVLNQKELGTLQKILTKEAVKA
ncbi:MAG: hypothetical protein ACREBS_10195 [Nitrososphaerales archaeon]